MLSKSVSKGLSFGIEGVELILAFRNVFNFVILSIFFDSFSESENAVKNIKHYKYTMYKVRITIKCNLMYGIS